MLPGQSWPSGCVWKGESDKDEPKEEDEPRMEVATDWKKSEDQ